jgi:hypothetical protein
MVLGCIRKSSLNFRIKKWISQQNEGRFARWTSSIIDLLRRRIVFVGGTRSDLNGNESSQFALIAILGCEHYTHHSKAFPIRSRRELAQVLDNENEARAAQFVFTFIGPWNGQSRQVDLYEMSSSSIGSFARAIFLLPETLLVSRAVPKDSILKVDRGQSHYFIAATGLWHRAGGLIDSERAFVLASGLPIDRIELVDPARLPIYLLAAIKRLRGSEWLDGLNKAFVSHIWRSFRPILTFTAVASLIYGALVSIYVVGALSLRQSQINVLGSEVGQLLVAQRRLDTLSTSSSRLYSTLAKTNISWRVWELSSTVWAGGGRIAAFNLFDGKVVIRGETPNATDLLSRISKLEAFHDAGFVSPVRQDRDQQQFVIELKLGEMRNAPK